MELLMSRVKRNFLVSAGIVITLATIIVLFIVNIPEPPSLNMTKARKALFNAEIASSKQYAIYQYQQAKNYYDSAYLEWKKQNYLFILKRDFSKARYFADKSFIHSRESKSLALANSKDISKYLEKKTKEIGSFINEYDDLLKSLPMHDDVNNNYRIAKMSFSETLEAFERNDLTMAMKKIAISEDRLEKAKFSISSQLNEYFKKYNHWKATAESAINSSKQKKNTIIVVDKFAKKCYVYKKGKLSNSFNVELGKNWIGNKMKKNDRATPEGIYQIQKKINGSQTKYYKALLINYPNDEDQERFSRAKKNGELSSHSDIGGLIEIHGDGGKGANWTNGCVALTNEDMDRLYDMVRTGTQVVIVGSLTKLSDIINF
jgi:lipoprotein-anchoring transpeptidase ErfK/SrfK